MNWKTRDFSLDCMGRRHDDSLVAHYAQACLSEFAREKSDLLRDYTKAVIHAVCLMILRKDEALEIVAQEP